MNRTIKCNYCGKMYIPDKDEELIEGSNMCQQCSWDLEEDKNDFEMFMGSN